jgi:septal ring factor EnvC (AmiA/AmiB activator)
VAKFVLTLLAVFIFSSVTVAQSVTDKQQELENERQQLNEELNEKQNLLKQNKQNTRQSLSDLAKINNRLQLQARLINNLSRQVDFDDDSIVKSQQDVRRNAALLDTLKLQYARSMVYSYKNSSNSDFLNFIFSAYSFNDAVKRVTYLKSYRNYRELQGENILKTEQLLRQGIVELSRNKDKKNEALQTQSKAEDALADQQKEKAQIVTQLKAQGKELSTEIAARKKQMAKVRTELASAIRKARQEAIAEAKVQAEQARKAKAAQDKIDKQNALNAANNIPTDNKNIPVTKPVVKPVAPAAPQQQLTLLPTAADVNLNANFISNKGSLPWPIDKGYIIMHFGLNDLPGGLQEDNPGLTIGGDIGASVKAIFDGEVTYTSTIDDMHMIVIKHGAYFSAYSNLSSITVTKGQIVHTGDVIGKVASNDEGNGSIDLMISNDKDNVNPELWLRHK